MHVRPVKSVESAYGVTEERRIAKSLTQGIKRMASANDLALLCLRHEN